MRLPTSTYWQILVLCLLGNVNSQRFTDAPTAAPGPAAVTPFPTMEEFNNEGQGGGDQKGSWYENGPSAAASSAPPATTTAAPSDTTTGVPGNTTSTLPPGIPVLPQASSNTAVPPPTSTATPTSTNETSTITAPPIPTTTSPARPATTGAPGESGTATLEPYDQTSQETESPAGDDEYEEGDDENEDGGDDTYGDGEGGWGGEPEPEGTKAPYVPPTGDDPFAKPQEESEEWKDKEKWTQESPEQMMHDKNVIIAIVSTVAFAFVLALCTAQQVIENPDGCCASICRCSVSFFCFFFKILCFPCRMCCGNKDHHIHDLIGDNKSYTHDLELT